MQACTLRTQQNSPIARFKMLAEPGSTATLISRIDLPVQAFGKHYRSLNLSDTIVH